MTMRTIGLLLAGLAVLLLASACSDADTTGVAVQVEWHGSGDEPDSYEGFIVNISPIEQRPNSQGTLQWRKVEDAVPIRGLTDASGFVRIDASPVFPYRVSAVKQVPRTSGHCDWSGAEWMESGGAEVTVVVAEACQ